jgi:peptide/nickel transport system permease protein
MEAVKQKAIVQKGSLNNRQKMVINIILSLLFLGLVIILNFALNESRLAMDFTLQKTPPTLQNPFGTDWLGRDMLTRTMKGLTLSVRIGLISSVVSVGIALFLGIMSATLGKAVDAFVSWLVDLFLGIPHMVLMILISFALGGGAKGVVIAVACTHWPALTRVVRAEVLQIRTSHYVQVSANMGKSRMYIAFKHILPHLLPQLFVGFVLLFPHAILHEASLTFLGFGLSPLKPAIGVILSEALQYLSTGMWWLVFFPGLALLLVVRCFDSIGTSLNKLLDPYTSQE